MNSDLLQRYLNGAATDSERQQCESYLSDPDAVVELAGESSDSLLETLRLTAQDTDAVDNEAAQDERLESLVRKVEGLVPRNAIGSEELARILDPPQDSDEIGRLARFRVVEFIAGGGMGLVFRAEDPDLERPVCIKVMNPLLASRSDAKQRFAREAKAASRLQHERIVTVFEVGEYRELPYLVMELLEGESIRQRLQREKLFPASAASNIITQVAEGLRYAHSRGFIHRDIKPDNIWLTPDGNVKLLDFGLARAFDESMDLTHSGTVVGTPRYMSPEQVQSQPLEATSDLFSLGIVLYEMLTGRSPFDRANVFSTLMSVANDTVSATWEDCPSSIPEPLRDLVVRLLAKDPKMRPASAEEVIATLNTPPGKPAPLAGSTAGAGRSWAAIGGAFVGFFGLLLALWIYQATDKGTLVIEADPSVEVNIKAETVTVTDPLSGKSYVVRIGSQPLPSGVYQLELVDRERELTLSSEVVTIRRNRKQLVTISLRPRKSTAEGPRLVVDKEGAAADTPWDRKSGKPFDLAALPPLTAKETKRVLGLETRKALAPAAMVREPQTLSGVESWSLEPIWVTSRYNLTRLSSNGQRIAQSGKDGYLRIFDPHLDLLLMLPITDEVVDIAWSPHPDVLLVLCQGRLSKEALVWRINKNKGELLQRIPVDADEAAWSWQGDRIAFESRSGISFHDVRKAKMYAIPGAQIQGRLSPYSWSSDGQLFASTVENSVKVWSLADGSIVHIFPEASDPQWLADGKQIAIRRKAGAQRIVEVWNMADLSRERAQSVSSQWIAATAQVDQNGAVAAALTVDGKLAAGVEGLATCDLVTPADMEQGVYTPNENILINLSEVQMSADGRRVLVHLFRRWAMYELADDQKPNRVSGWAALGSQWLPELSHPVGADREASFLSIYYGLKRREVSIDTMNLRSLESFGVAKRRDWDLEEAQSSSQVQASLSPNRRHALIWERASAALRLVDLKSGATTQVSNEALAINEYDWSSDGRFAVGTHVLSSRLRRNRTFCVVDVDTSSSRIFDPVGDRASERTPVWEIPDHQIVGNRLYLVINKGVKDDGDERRSRYLRPSVFALECYDLESLELMQTMELGEYASVARMCLIGDQVVLFGEKSRTSLGRGSRTLTVFSKKLDGSDAEALQGASGIAEPLKVVASHDGKYMMFHGRGDFSNRHSYYILPTASLLESGAKPSSTSFHWHRTNDKPDGRFTGNPPLAVWHSRRNQVAVHLKYSIEINDLDNDTEFEVRLDNVDYRQAIAADFGWIIQTDDQLLAYGFDGRYLGCWLNTMAPAAGRYYPLPNRWIHTNGSSSGVDGADQFCLVQLVGNQVITVRRDTPAWNDLPDELTKAQSAVQWPWSD